MILAKFFRSCEPKVSSNYLSDHEKHSSLKQKEKHLKIYPVCAAYCLGTLKFVSLDGIQIDAIYHVP